MTSTERRFSFLTSGPLVRLELPEDFDDLPELTSPLSVGYGYRSFDFLPAHIDSAGGEGLKLIDTLTDRDGRVVELYERAEPPRQWYLRWILSNGALYTHLREDEGPERATEHVAKLGIEEREGLPPFLLPESPLANGASARPGYREESVYRSRSNPRRIVVLNRPSYIAANKILRRPGSADKISLRGGAKHGIEVTVHGGDDLDSARELMSTVLASLSNT